METRKLFKGGEFLIRAACPEDVFIPEEFTTEHKMIYQAARDFVQKELAGQAERIEEKDEAQVRKWFRLAGDIGLNAVDVPEAYGGEGMDKISACLVTEAMGAGHSFCVSHTCQTGIGSLPILLFGTAAQKRQYIPKLASGEFIGAYCLTESGAGSDALNARTTAELSADGEHYLLNGEKIFITNGAWADVLTVFAKVDGRHFTGFIVEKTFPGFATGPEEKKLGIKGSSTVSVILNNCRVPKENVLFEVGQGHKIAFNVLNIGRYKLGPATTGGMKTAIAAAAGYAGEREQFGKKIASFGMIRDKLARMTVNAYVAETVSYRLAAAIQDQLDTLDGDSPSSGAEIARAIEEYSIECALVKVACSELLDETVDELVQVYGGNGYIAEFPAERAYRDSRINRIFEGTNEINRMVASGTLFKRALNNRLDMFGALESARHRLAALAPAPISEDAPLAHAREVIDAGKSAFLITAGHAGTRLMSGLVAEQEVLGLLSDMMIRIYLAESGWLRAMRVFRTAGARKAALHVAAARVFAAESLPEMLFKARQVLAFVGGDGETAGLIRDIDKLARFPQEDIVTLKRSIADKVVQVKKYPL